MKGSCLCGSIRYHVDQFDSPVQHCSCNTCRKAHAAAFNTGALVRRAHFRWLNGSDLLSAYESSPGKFRRFCSKCGSQLIAENPDQDHLVLRVATLDEDPGVRPSRQIWASNEAPWLDYGPHIPKYPEFPPKSG